MKPTLSDRLRDAYPAGEASGDFAEKIVNLAYLTDLRVTRKLQLQRRLRLSFGGISLAAVLVGGFVLEPRVAFAILLRKVHTRLDAQASVHYKVWTITPDGSRVVSQEIWHQGEADRIERGGGREVTFVRGQSRWVYDVPAKMILAYTDDPRTHGFKGFNGTDLLKELENSGWLDKVRSEDAGDQIVTSVIGRTERTRLRLWVDKASDLPTKVEIQSPRGSGWSTVQEGTFDFSQAGKGTNFAGALPHGIPVIDAKLARAELQAKWQKPLFSYHATRIYDVQANERGDVFVIYSGGKIRLEGDEATYLSDLFSDEFQPVMHTMNSDRVDGFTSVYGDLRGKLFTPVVPGSWRPLHLRITCVHPDSDGMTRKEGHPIVGKDGKTYYTWSLEDMAQAIEKHEATAPDRDKRTFDFLITNSNCATVPTYMPLMPRGLQSATELGGIEAGARAKYFRAQHLYADAEREIRAEIRDFDLMCLEAGSPGVQPQSYFDLYEVLAAEGKRDEAIAALKAVPDQMVYKDEELQRRLDAANAKEGLP